MKRVRDGPCRSESDDRRARRLRRAAVIVVMLFAVLLLAVLADGAARPSVLREAAALASEGGSPSSSGMGILASLDSEEAGTACVPDGFEDEALALAGRREVHASDQNGIVGFTSSEESGEAFAAIAGELERNGWSQVPSGWATCGSFVKGEGRYRWMFVACVGAGGSTSVVVQYATTEERS